MVRSLVFALAVATSAPALAANLKFPDFSVTCGGGPVQPDGTFSGSCGANRFYIEYQISEAPKWITDDRMMATLFGWLSDKDLRLPKGVFAGLDVLEPAYDASHNRHAPFMLPKPGDGFCQRARLEPQSKAAGVYRHEPSQSPYMVRCFAIRGFQMLRADFFPTDFRGYDADSIAIIGAMMASVEAGD